MYYRYRLSTETGVAIMESNLLSDCLMIYYAIKTVASSQNDSSFYMIVIHDRERELDTHVYDLEAHKVISEPER